MAVQQVVGASSGREAPATGESGVGLRVAGSELIYAIGDVTASVPAPSPHEFDIDAMLKAFALGQIYRTYVHCSSSSAYISAHAGRVKYLWSARSGDGHCGALSASFTCAEPLFVAGIRTMLSDRAKKLEEDKKAHDEGSDEDDGVEAITSMAMHVLPGRATHLHLSPPVRLDPGIVPGMKIYGEPELNEDETWDDDLAVERFVHSARTEPAPRPAATAPATPPEVAVAVTVSPAVSLASENHALTVTA
jgi:hypothetical protein